MTMFLNTAAWNGVCAVPNDIADKHLKLASHEALKVILCLLRKGTQQDEAALCRELGITDVQLQEALLYWEQAGLIGKQEPAKAVPAVEPKKTAVARQVRATRSEIARRATESREIALVLRQAEMTFARPLKETEKSSLVYILDNLGMKAEVALMLLEFAAAQGRTTASFLESTAVDWVNRGVDTVPLAEREMTLADQKKHAWAIVKRAMSIDDRRPSAKESEACLRWVEEWQFSEAMLRLAYDQCVDQIGKRQFNYIDKILAAWHAAGVTDPQGAEAAQKKKSAKKEPQKGPSFDLSLF